MEVALFLTLAGVGYFLNKTRKTEWSSSTTAEDGGVGKRKEVAGDMPSMRNVYDSRYIDTVRAEEARRATVAAHLAIDPKASRMINRHQRRLASPTVMSIDPPPPPIVHSSLSGIDIPIENFTHANMVPFYRGTLKEDGGRGDGFVSRLETFTGTEPPRLKRKIETAPLFELEKTNVFGVTADQVRDARMGAITAPRNRANSAPMPELVGRPGIKGGATGDVYYDEREFMLPRTVDALRTTSNPKVTFDGRILPGQGTTVARPEIAPVHRMRASTVVERTQDDWFKTTGAFTAEQVRPDLTAAVKDTARQDTTRAYVGAPGASAASAATSYEATPGGPTFRQRLGAPQQGPAASVYKKVDDYGKASVAVYGNSRDITSANTYKGNLVTAVKALVAPLQDLVRPTRKEDFDAAPRAFGNVEARIKKLTVYDTNDIMRTTRKETGIAEAPNANLRGGAYMSTVWDPESGVARTTLKEAGLAETPAGNLMGPGARRLTVYDPEDVARATLKEAGLAAAPSANLRGGALVSTAWDPEDVTRTTRKETGLADAPSTNLRGGAYKSVAWDPEDVARTTQKETQMFDGHGGTAITTGRRAGIAVDPDDAARTTGRQTVRATDTALNVGPVKRSGAAYDAEAWRPAPTHKEILTDKGKGGYKDGNVDGLQGRRGGAYANTAYEANATLRQDLADNDYYGAVAAPGKLKGGYDTAAEDGAKDTHRQFTSDHEHFGGSSTAVAAQMSYEDVVQNAETRTAREDLVREELEHGRMPTSSSVKVASGAEAFGEQQRELPQRATTTTENAGWSFPDVAASRQQVPTNASLVGQVQRVRGLDFAEDVSDRRLMEDMAASQLQRSTNSYSVSVLDI